MKSSAFPQCYLQTFLDCGTRSGASTLLGPISTRAKILRVAALLVVVCFAKCDEEFAYAFDLSIQKDGGAVSLSWDSEVARNYQVLSGQATDTIGLPYGPLITAVTTNISLPLVLGQEQEFFVVEQGQRVSKMLSIDEGAAGEVVIRWASEANQLYQVERSGDFGSGFWFRLESNVPSTPPANTYSDTTAGGLDQGIYRILVWTNGSWELFLDRSTLGFKRLTVHPGDNLFSQVFEPIDGLPWTPDRVFGDQLPTGTVSRVSRADLEGAEVTETFTASGWSPNRHAFPRGRSFWLTNSTPSPMTLFLGGEVPSSTTATGPTTTVEIQAGYTGLSYGYPVAKAWTDTTLAQGATRGDRIWVVDPMTRVFTSYLYGGFSPTWVGASSLVIEPGMGFYYQTASPQTWLENKPYTYP